MAAKIIDTEKVTRDARSTKSRIREINYHVDTIQEAVLFALSADNSLWKGDLNADEQESPLSSLDLFMITFLF